MTVCLSIVFVEVSSNKIITIVGLSEEVCLCCHSRPPPQHHLRLLEDGLGDELLLCHHAHQSSGEEQGMSCVIREISSFMRFH